jgi:hypothetical protein
LSGEAPPKEYRMKIFLSILMLLPHSLFAADCDIEPLKKQIVSQYTTPLPVNNEKGELGHAKGKNFVVADYLMRIKNESFLIANFEMDIKWLKGETQTIKTMIVANVDPATCTIESYESGDTLGTSMSKR